jgi:hypothetical protein
MQPPDDPQPAPSEYPAVKDSHVVPRMYLKGWTDDKNLACVHRVKPPPGAPAHVKPRPRQIGVGGIAVREFFYARTRPGETELFHDVEASLGDAENAATDLVRRVRDRWPLSLDDKSALAEFVALQTVRGPAEFERQNELGRVLIDEFVARTDHERGLGVADGRLTEESVAAHSAFVENRTRQLLRMHRHQKIGAVMIGSMQWTLVEFDGPELLTSDHPVHLWPLGRRTLRPSVGEVAGVRETLEVKWPIAPNVALLATWRDLPDADAPVAGTPQMASSLNSLLIAQADEQWLHVPEVTPSYKPAGERLNPWSLRLFEDYVVKDVPRRARLRKAIELAAPLLADEKPAEEFSIAYIARD